MTEPSEALLDFRARVQIDEAGCWLWRGIRDMYGQYNGQPAHRASWELHHGPIADGLVILHGCDVRGCVNPGHLRPGTLRENAADRVRAIARARRPQKPLVRPSPSGFPWEQHDPNDKRTIEGTVRVNAYERALIRYVAGLRGTSIGKTLLDFAMEGVRREIGRWEASEPPAGKGEEVDHG